MPNAAGGIEESKVLSPVDEKDSQDVDQESKLMESNAPSDEEYVVECMFIKKANFVKIPLFEQMIIKEFAEGRADIKTLGY